MMSSVWRLSSASHVLRRKGVCRVCTKIYLSATLTNTKTSRSSTLTRTDSAHRTMPPPNKKRKLKTSAVEEVTFDYNARQEYLTGFHKRKVERQKIRQDLAKRRAREERIEGRKKVSCVLCMDGALY